MIMVYHDELKKQLHHIHKSILHVMKIEFGTGVVVIDAHDMYLSSFTFHQFSLGTASYFSCSGSSG